MDEYTCIAGDTFDTIALRLYRDEAKSYLLMRENPELNHVQVFGGGEVLWVPEDEEQASETAPWKAR